ncbi:hypothetical protein HMPREF9554_00344 [Treponema phagedenis F0421]|nr:hypothetical protein HMPREF9554_00344 [Treponema phagedenis F0421]
MMYEFFQQRCSCSLCCTHSICIPHTRLMYLSIFADMRKV